MKRRIAIASILFTGGLSQLIALRAMPYTSSYLVLDRASTSSPVQDGRFWIGDRQVRVADYVEAASLAPFRHGLADACRQHPRPLEFALCVSDRMAALFAHGEPRTEFVAPTFDPAEDLVDHLSGRDGHCVTRAGIGATTLLANGMAARAVQLITPSGLGHNVMEVWDDRHGWLVIDPTYGDVAYLKPGGRQRVIERVIKAPSGANDIFLARSDAFQGKLIYPEPWLYTRVGTRWAPQPFRGLYAASGTASLRFVVGHWALIVGFFLSLLSASLVLLLRRPAPALTRVPPDDALPLPE